MSEITETERVRTVVDALLALERLHGTRALALAIDEIGHVDSDTTGYSERRWAAQPEKRERMESTIRAIHKADGREHEFTPKPVTATPLPPIEDTEEYRRALAIAAQPFVDDIDGHSS